MPQAQRFALPVTLQALHSLISTWPRRGRSLVMAGCGEGIALETFWGTGFDVTGVERNPRLLKRAVERLSARADLRQGNPGHLPFDDNSFDFSAVVELPGMERSAEPFMERALEACRCAKYGVVFGFFNAWSLYALRRSPVATTRGMTGHSVLSRTSLFKALKKAGFAGHVTSSSLLYGTAASWKDTLPGRWLNARPSRIPFGAYMVCRLDFDPPATLTPLLSPVVPPQTAQAAAGPLSSPLSSGTMKQDGPFRGSAPHRPRPHSPAPRKDTP